jgi:two-component system chemotaxis response regulator CheY
MSKVLIVDDFKTQRAVIQLVCDELGFESVHATNGKEALEIVRSQPIKLVLTDNEMPEMNGMELIKTIRETRSKSELPVIMITSVTEAHSTAFHNGVNEFVAKPIDRQELARTIEKVLNANRPSSKYKVLLIDDVSMQTAIWAKALEMNGFEFHEAHSAQEGLAALRASEFHAIITDYHMPQVDGGRFVNKIKSMDEFKYIPIVIISSNPAIAQSPPNGVEKVFVKPFNSTDVKSELRRLVHWEQ